MEAAEGAKEEEKKAGTRLDEMEEQHDQPTHGAPTLTGVVRLKGTVPGGLIIISLVQGMRSCVPHLASPSP